MSIVVDGNEPERVTSDKLLGLTMSSNLLGTIMLVT